MTTLIVQIAVLDAAAESLAAVSDTVTRAGADAADAVRTLGGACPGSALQLRLPELPLEHLTAEVSAQCRQIAHRVADGAQTYRAMDEALRAGIDAARGTEPVPR